MATTIRLTVLTGAHKDRKFCFCGPARCEVGRALDCFVQLSGTEIGGVISILSLIGFYGWHVALSGLRPHGPYFIVLTAPGALFIVTWLLSLRDQTKQMGTR